jgi:type III secretory pathway component EscT
VDVVSTAALADVAPLAAGALLHGLRLLPAAVLSPILGGPLVPPFARAALAFGLGACAWAAAGSPAAPDGAAFAPIAARELAVGAAFGFFAALPFEAARAAGRLADTLRGATLAELHVAPLRQRETAVGDLLVHWTVVLAATAGGGRLVVAALVESFAALPAGAPVHPWALAGGVLDAAGELLGAALCVGAPAAAGVLAADLVLAVGLRAAPQLGLHASAQPARAALGLAAVAVASAATAGRLTSLVALSATFVRRASTP